jgi:hypothetical protein
VPSDEPTARPLPLHRTSAVARDARQGALIPAYLLVVPAHLSLDSPAPVRDSEAALPLLELIEQQASEAGVRVDARIERGRTYREALERLVERERFDVVMPGDGFADSDLEWLAARELRPSAVAT